MRKTWLGTSVFLLLSACSAAGNSGGTPFGSGSTSGGGNGNGGSGNGGNGSGGLVITSSGGTGQLDDGGCAEVVDQAEKLGGGKADIIFVLDNSGSMTDEIAAIKNNLSGFSTQIINAGIDARVIMISSPVCGTDFLCGITYSIQGFAINGICIPSPLGNVGPTDVCPNLEDSKPPGFLHVGAGVDSHNALERIQGTFATYQSILRPDAAKTFVAITDDESNVPAATFTSWVNSQAVFTSAVWRFSGVFCPPGGLGGGNCAGTGVVYNELVTATGGIMGDMGAFSAGTVDAQFKTVFDSLAAQVTQDARPVSCEWGIPAPTNGGTIDFNTVNVRYTTQSQPTPQPIYWVPDAASCTDKFSGWHYDNPSTPTRVVACPQVCPVLQGDLTTTVRVQYGCKRDEPPLN